MNFTQPTALILIDMQQGFENQRHWGGNRNNPDAERNMETLLAHWRKNNWPVAHVQHASTNPASPLHPSNPGHALMPSLTPQGDEPLFVKQVNSAFIGTNLKSWLDDRHIKAVVMVGMTTNHCVSTSVRMAGDYGYQTFVVADATATFDRRGLDGTLLSAQQIHDVSLASLNEEFAQVIQTRDALQS